MQIERRQVQLAKNAEQMERELGRLIRVTNRIAILRAQRKRLLKPRPLPAEAVDQPDDPVPTFTRDYGSDGFDPQPTTFGNSERPDDDVPTELDDGLDIPPELDRNKKLQALADPRTKEKKAERRAVEREVRDRELTGKRRKMPLSGKEALAALR